MKWPISKDVREIWEEGLWTTEGPGFQEERLAGAKALRILKVCVLKDWRDQCSWDTPQGARTTLEGDEIRKVKVVSCEDVDWIWFSVKWEAVSVFNRIVSWPDLSFKGILCCLRTYGSRARTKAEKPINYLRHVQMSDDNAGHRWDPEKLSDSVHILNIKTRELAHGLHLECKKKKLFQKWKAASKG
jgi:hypothetical protein